MVSCAKCAVPSDRVRHILPWITSMLLILLHVHDNYASDCLTLSCSISWGTCCWPCCTHIMVPQILLLTVQLLFTLLVMLSSQQVFHQPMICVGISLTHQTLLGVSIAHTYHCQQKVFNCKHIWFQHASTWEQFEWWRPSQHRQILFSNYTTFCHCQPARWHHEHCR